MFGDADFASNSFFPYLANADMVLGSISWLIREERAPVVKPPVEVLPTVALTGAQVRAIFIATRAGATRFGGIDRGTGVVAAASLTTLGVKPWAWAIAAALAAGFIGLLAFQGERPEPGLAQFTPVGLLADWPIEQVTFVEVVSGEKHQSFRRDPEGGWRSGAADASVSADLDERIEQGLKLLHNSGPQRTDLGSEQLAEFGLAPPRLTVTARKTGGASTTIEFGGTNPLGLERYARIAGRNEILLMPSFVAEPWESVVEVR